MLVAMVAYLANGFGGAAPPVALLGNTHDGTPEAAMNGALVPGPIAAIIAYLIAHARTGRRLPARAG
jgi:hypothetical protein